MEKINDRISYDKDEERTRIEIKAVFDKTKQNLLFTWVLLWTAAGLFVLVELLLAATTKSEKLFMIIWLAFWAYFEYKVVLAFRWHKWGKEIIEIDDENIVLYKEISGRGLPRKYPILDVKDFRRIDKQKSFSIVLGQSYWVVGGETLTFTYDRSDLIFGTHLAPDVANKLLGFIKHEYKRYLNLAKKEASN